MTPPPGEAGRRRQKVVCEIPAPGSKTGVVISEQPLIQSTLPLLAENALEVLQQGCLSLSIRRCFFPWLLAQLVQISYVCSGAPAPIPIVMTPLFWTNTHYFNSKYQHGHVLSPVEELLLAKYKNDITFVKSLKVASMYRI